MTIGVVVGIAALGALVRVLAASGELWLDEIWSYRVAHLLTTPLGVFTEIHTDNNHHLNTLYLRLVPEGTASWIAYRLHAIAAGSVAIVLAALVARRAGAPATIGAATLTAGSFFLIVYSSEARGYALAVCFAFAGVLLLDRYFETRRWIWGVAFGLAAVLGLLSHLTFLHAWAGLIAWTALREGRRGWASAARAVAIVHLIPLVALAALYWVDLRHLSLGGGPLTTPGEIAASALALTFGAPDAGGWKALAALAAAIAGVVSIATIRRSGSDIWILFAVTIFVAPAATLAVVDSGIIYERYLLVATAFLTLSYAWLVARLARRSLPLATLLVVVFLAGNAVRTWQFIDRGRGHVMAAIDHMTGRTQGRIAVGSDHDFRIGRVLGFHLTFAPDAQIAYYPRDGWPFGGPEWLLVHSFEPEFTPQPDLTVSGARYTLAQSYPYAGLSGWNLALYHNVRNLRP